MINFIEEAILYVKNFILEFLHINNLIAELNMLNNRIIKLENEKYENVEKGETILRPNIYPPVDDMLNYRWETFKFVNVIPRGQTTSQIQINLKHKGFKTNFATINGANHKMLITVVDPENKAYWQTPWMDACNATSLEAMFAVDGTRCIYGSYSTTEHRVCYIGEDTTSSAIFYIRVGIPRELKIECDDINLIPVNKFKKKML